MFTFSNGYFGGQSGETYASYKYQTEIVFGLNQPDLLKWTGADYTKSTYGYGLNLGEQTRDIFGADLDDIRLNQLETREMVDTSKPVNNGTKTVAPNIANIC